MGRNNGKKGKRTRYAKWQSIMAKLDNYLADQKAENKGKVFKEEDNKDAKERI